MDYIAEACLTKSDKFYGDLVSYKQFSTILKEAISSLRELDKIKKSLFYGKLQEEIFELLDQKETDCKTLPLWISNHPSKDAIAYDIIHGIIGKATESGELLELLYGVCVVGKEFDEINCLEEVGDGLWYDAILLKALDSNFEKVQKTNIAKLRARYPNRFTSYDAENRNLENERSILERHGE